jgi:ferric-dicitrate binding protein FerR (iron transport regulator)
MQNEAISKQVFFEAWSGNSTLLQRRLIQEWLSIPGNIEIYYEWLDEWERGNLQVYSDVNISYQNFLLKRANTNEKVETNKFPFAKRWLVRMIAATVVGAMLAVSVFFSKDFIFFKSFKTAYGEVLKINLPDESVVFMNANSSIRYSRFNFNGGIRKVYISGEAEFDVVHTATHTPFEVYGDNDLKISVLGTKFVVYTREDSSSVVLSEGKIELSKIEAGKNLTKILKPGDQYTAVANKTSSIVSIQNPEKVSSWKNHEFIFDATSLNRIALQINDAFGYEMTFDTEDIAQKRISGSFHAENVVELVDAIAQLLDMNYKIVENEIFFSE